VLAVVVAVGLLRLDPDAWAQVDTAPRLIEEVSRLVSGRFYNPEVVARVWARARAAHLPAAATSEEVATALDAMLAELGASHTGHYAPSELAYYELLDIFARDEFAPRLRALFPDGRVAYTGIGVVPRAFEGRVFLAGVYHGSPAERAGLLVGDEIVSADGEPFDPIASFANQAGMPVRLEVRRVEAGPSFPVDVVPERIRPNEFFLSAMRASIRVIERDDRRWGYIRVWSYARRQYQNLLIEELAQGRLKDVDGLVLDLRGGWGGAQPEYAELFVGGAPIMTYAGRDGREAFASFRWRRPVVVLVDEGTRSGKEVVTYGLKRQGVRVVGTRTAGALLAGRAFLLSDGSLLVLAVSDVRVEGERLEGRGVIPDVEVPFRLPYAAGRDPQLEAALAELAHASRANKLRRDRRQAGGGGVGVEIRGRISAAACRPRGTLRCCPWARGRAAPGPAARAPG
jgi:carboxyl-terminal processing protease